MSPLRLIFAGVGAAFSSSRLWQTNLLFEYEDAGKPKRLLYDCGSDARHSLGELGVDAQDIPEVFVSHLHADHVGGLEWLALRRYFGNRRANGSTRLYLPNALDPDIWEKTLRGGLGTLEVDPAVLRTFFTVQPLNPNQSLRLGDCGVMKIFTTVHHYDGDQLQPCFGCRIVTQGGKKILYTCDTQFVPNPMRQLYAWADVIFHDCETAPFKSTIHAHYEDLLTLPDDIRAKMHLVHYQDNFAERQPTQDGFEGFVRKGQVFVYD